MTRTSRTSLGPRAKTIPAKRITRAMLAEGRRLHPPVDVERPQTRGDCAAVMRPCPFVACKHSMYLDVNPETGSIKLNRPDLDPWEMPADASCVLDIAERGALTLDETAVAMNFTRERARQVEVRGLLTLQAMADVHGLELHIVRAEGYVEDDVSGVGGATEMLVGHRPEVRR